MATLKWLPEAQVDLQRLFEFIAPHSHDAAAKAVMTLVSAAESLSYFPQKGRPWGAGGTFRELPVSFGARGYVIRYRKHNDQVIIVRVWHAREQR